MNSTTHGLIFLLLFAAVNARNFHTLERMSIDVYFETLCPDSYNFIKHQLVPTWSFIKDRVYLRFIPFGKSRSVANGSKFHCQHGPRECEGNKMVSCALNEINDQDEQIQYVNCFMTVFKNARHDRGEFGQKCARDLGISWDNLRHCYNSETGTEFQLQAEAETHRIQPAFVPTIIYNGIFEQYLQDESQKNFRLIVCTLLSKNHGLEC